ncbi:MFS transporter [Undibacterium arcticum]
MAFAPESVRFFALRKNRAAIERILRRMNCADAWNGSLSTTAPEASASVVRLFNDGKAVGTFLLWATYFMGLLMTYFLASWIPVFARQSGLSIQTAVTAAVTLNLGSVFGCLIVGRLADRFGPAKPIASAFALGAVAIASIGQVGTSGPALCALTFVAGALSLGSQMCTTGLCASFYHTSVRATGLGWSLGVGRVGAIVGPVLGGHAARRRHRDFHIVRLCRIEFDSRRGVCLCDRALRAAARTARAYARTDPARTRYGRRNR